MDPFRVHGPFFNVGPVMADPRAFIKIETRPTLYEAWAAGLRWVMVRGVLCRVSAIVGGPAGKLWLQAGQGRALFCGFVSMDEFVSPCRPNSLVFDRNRRK